MLGGEQVVIKAEEAFRAESNAAHGYTLVKTEGIRLRVSRMR